MSTTIALSDVLSGTGQGIVLGTGPDGAPIILAWRPQILGVQAPPVALYGFLQTVLAHAHAWPDDRACGVVAVLPAVLMAAIADHPRLEAVDGASPTFAADLTALLPPTLAAGAVLGLTVPADGSALLTSATIWSRLSALPLACPPLLLTAGVIAPPRMLSARCCQIALQPPKRERKKDRRRDADASPMPDGEAGDGALVTQRPVVLVPTQAGTSTAAGRDEQLSEGGGEDLDTIIF